MTPKEKAKELFDKFYIVCQEYTEEIQCSIQAKKCALECVDIIINNLSFSGSFSETRSWHNEIVFWTNVKQEIENL